MLFRAQRLSLVNLAVAALTNTDAETMNVTLVAPSRRYLGNLEIASKAATREILKVSVIY